MSSEATASRTWSSSLGKHEKRRLKSKGAGLFGDIKNDIIAAMGEFIATVCPPFYLMGSRSRQVLFLLFALGGVQVQTNTLNASASQGSGAEKLLGYYYTSITFGLSLFGIASIFYNVTGSLLNPSVSLALCLVGVIKPVRFLLVSTAQMVGAIAAAAVVNGLSPGPLRVGVGLNLNTNKAQGVFIEMFATCALTLTVLMLAAEKSRLTPMAPLMFGAVLAVVMLFSVPFTGGAVNTARAFGPACIEGFNTEHWIYWVGPTAGALLATAIYYLLKVVHFW